MAKDKYDFISEILENKKLNTSQKEKVFKLLANELKKDKLGGLELEGRIQKIEEALNIETSSIIDLEGHPEPPPTPDPEPPQTDTISIKYINPNRLSKFLQAYNQDPILKTTCHEIDEDELNNILEITKGINYNFEEHYREIIKAFEDLEKTYSDVDFKIRGLIRGYLAGKSKKGTFDGWSTNNIKINWNSPELLIWAINNSGIPPNPNETLSEQHNSIGFEFDEIKDLHINSFSKLVLFFKKLFHIRNDNSLKGIILNLNEKKKWNDKIEFEITTDFFKSNIEFFTDVDKLTQAYYRIIEIILEVVKEGKQDKPKVKLSLKEEDETIIFSIHHINTIFTKSIKNLIERTGQKHLNLIEKQINGLCDLYVKADFGNSECAEINLWNGEGKVVTKLESFNGVEHKLVFTK